jgi:hypothetical protein
LWHHLGDIHSTHRPDAGKKRQSQREKGEDGRVEISGAAKKKQHRLKGKLEDKDCILLGGQKSAPKGRSKDPLGHTFVNISTMDFDPCPADGVEMAVVSRWLWCLVVPHHVLAPQLAASGTITMAVIVRILRSRLCQATF